MHDFLDDLADGGVVRWVVGLGLALLIGGPVAAQPVQSGSASTAPDPGQETLAERYQRLRERMVQRHLAERGIANERVLDAFRTVPRHIFVEPEHQAMAYEDESLPIGEGQTITPPFAVAFMTQALDPKPTDRVYEVGTGSGYQAAILGQLAKEVYSVEIHRPLGLKARKRFDELGYGNIKSRVGDGYAGWPEAAPFDAIIVTCAPNKIPPPLIDQLKEGGRMVIPLGSRYDQRVYVLTKVDGKMRGEAVQPTLFVPMTGKAQSDAGQREGVLPELDPDGRR